MSGWWPPSIRSWPGTSRASRRCGRVAITSSACIAETPPERRIVVPTRVLVTGGAGFIGSNVSDGFLRAGARVTIFDNFSRPGAQANARWLVASHGRRVRIVRGDIRWPRRRLAELVNEADLVIHN